MQRIFVVMDALISFLLPESVYMWYALTYLSMIHCRLSIVRCVSTQCCSLAVIGYRIATFNDCAEAAEELKHVCHFYFIIKHIT